LSIKPVFASCVLRVFQYYLSDDTMELVEVRFDNDGQDPFPMFMSRHRCPKNRDDIEADFPLGAMEITDEEVKEYFTPVDFCIGKTIIIYGRRFLIYDVDNFTKAFYWKNFGMTDFTPVDVEIPKPPLPKQVLSCHCVVNDVVAPCSTCIVLRFSVLICPSLFLIQQEI